MNQDIINQDDRETKRSVLLNPFIISFFLLLAVLVAGKKLNNRKAVLPNASLESFPREIGGWTAYKDLPVSQDVIDILKLTKYLNRFYLSPDQKRTVSLYIGYVNQQEEGPLIHTPQVCLPSSGWTVLRRKVVPWWRSEKVRDPRKVNLLFLQQGEDKELSCYWYQSRGRIEAYDYLSRFNLLLDSIRMGRTDGSLVRFMTQLGPGESWEAAEKRFSKFIQQAIPLINAALPGA